MAKNYDPNKDYSAAIEAAKASGASQAEINRLQQERQNKIDAVYGGKEPNMYGSNQTYSQLSGSASSGNSSAQSSIDKAVDFSNSNNSNYFGNDSTYKAAYEAAASGNWDKVGSLVNELATWNDKYGTYDLAETNRYMNDLQNLFGYDANEYYKGIYEGIYGEGTWGGENQEVIPQQGADLLEQLMGNLNYGNYGGSNAPQYGGSQWDSVLDTLANQLLNMSYTDWTKGDQYAALAGRYGQQGQMSMRDVLGQISSRTGGLASSYATTAAQQQYNNWMADLENAAMEMYGVERNEMLDNAKLAQQYAKDDYNRYLDALDQWNADRNFNYNVWQDQQKQLADRAEMMAAAGDFSGYKGLGYTDDQIDLLQQVSQGGGTMAKPTLTAAQTLTALKNGVVNDTTLAAYEYYYGEPYGGTASGSGSTGKTGGGGGYDNGNLTTEQIKTLQQDINKYLPEGEKIAVDGKWGSATTKAAGGLSAAEYAEIYYKQNSWSGRSDR